MRVRVALLAIAATLLFSADAHAALPGANGHIAYLTDRGDNAELWVAEANGASGQRVLRFPAAVLEDPVWSPGGDSIAYSLWDDGETGFDIWTVSVTFKPDGTVVAGEPFQVTKTTNDETAPTWSPVTNATSPYYRRIAYQSIDVDDPEAISQIHMVGIDGKNRKIVTTENDYQAFRPSWSPDGTQIAYVEECFDFDCASGSDSEIARIAPSGDKATKRYVTVNDDYDGSPDASPDWDPTGQWIAFERAGKVRQASASSVTTPGTISFIRPTTAGHVYSPDGHWLLDELNGDIFVRGDASLGYGFNNITRAPSTVERSPDWRRVAAAPRSVGVVGKSASLSVGTDGTKRLDIRATERDSQFIRLDGADPAVGGVTVRLYVGGVPEYFTLPAVGWSRRDSSDGGVTYKYKDSNATNSAITGASIYDRDSFREIRLDSITRARSVNKLGFDLVADPNTVKLSFVIGGNKAKRFCLGFGPAFGGTGHHVISSLGSKRWFWRSTDAPGSCIGL